MSVLRVTPEALVESGGQTAAAAPAAVPAAQVTPAASDPVSVSVAYALGARIAVIAAQTRTAHAQTQQAATHLVTNAADYATQEYASTSGLGFDALPAAATAGVLPTPAPVVPPQIPAPQPATMPTTGKRIAELIHAGPGPQPLQQAADRLRSHAERLATTSSELRSAAANLQTSWFSGAGEAAQRRIVELADFYDQHGQTAMATARLADTQAVNVSRARTAIPRPEEFDDLEQRLAAALRANAMPGSAGVYAPVIAQLQSRLAALNAEAAAGYADYTTDAQNGVGSIQAVDFKTGPPFPEDTGGESDNDDRNNGKTKDGHGGSRSVGKGSKTHIGANGDGDQQWGSPTDPHQIAGGSGMFDDGKGNWGWHGPGYEGGAHAEHHSDGYTGEAKAGAWLAKGDVGWSGDVLGHQATVSGNAGAGVHSEAGGAITDHGIGTNLDAFIGVEAGSKAEYDLRPVDLSLDTSARYGAGISGGFDFGMQDHKLVIGGTLGGAWGPGGKISPHIAIDPKLLTDGLKTVSSWVDDLFG